MEFPLDLDRMLAYERWANAQVIASLEAMPAAPPKGWELLAHLLGAQVAWVDRMTAGRDPADWEAWETSDPDFVRRAWKESVPAAWARLLADPAARDPERTFTYVNFLGQTMSAKVGDVLLQLLLHSSYHRGQIATAVRAVGGEPAVADYIKAVRGGALA